MFSYQTRATTAVGRVCALVVLTSVVAMVVLSFVMVKTVLGQDLSPENLRRLGRHAFDEGRYSDAERVLRSAVEGFLKDANSLEVAQTLGDLANVRAAEEKYA